MALTPEGKVKEKVKAILKRRGVWYCMPRGTTYGKAGVPDFLCCYEGRFLAIETKAGDGKATPLQLNALRGIINSAGCALVVRETNIEDVERMLDFIDTAKCTAFAYRGFDDEADKRKPDTR